MLFVRSTDQTCALPVNQKQQLMYTNTPSTRRREAHIHSFIQNMKLHSHFIHIHNAIVRCLDRKRALTVDAKRKPSHINMLNVGQLEASYALRYSITMTFIDVICIEWVKHYMNNCVFSHINLTTFRIYKQ